MWGRNLQYYCVKKCIVKVGTLLFVWRKFVRTFAILRPSQEKSHNEVFYILFYLSWISRCRDILYVVEITCFYVYKKGKHTKSSSSERTAMYCTVAIWGLIPNKCVWFYLFQTRPKYPWRLTGFPDWWIPVVYFFVDS